MNRTQNIALVREIMLDYARLTGLAPPAVAPRRYLWTDAFAVCNYLELVRQTSDAAFRDLALRLVDQVHHTLGRHRDDDPRSGWISRLDSEEGEQHPTKGGLRIGKRLNEREPGEPQDERLEWDQDGQYYHYLTKWMHALNRVSQSTCDPKYLGWAIELAKAAHARFTYVPPAGGRRMYWKMSIDLSYPLVLSMGQHDPLDGLVTYSELQAAATTDFKNSLLPDLKHEIAEMAEICRRMSALATSDPLGIGGLLSDALRIAQLMMKGGFAYERLLETVLSSALLGMDSFARGRTLELPAEHRLAFRELGLSIGLAAVEDHQRLIEENPRMYGGESSLHRRVEGLLRYVPLGAEIEQFWTDDENRKAATWIEHREINMVMLATSIAPGEFLTT